MLAFDIYQRIICDMSFEPSDFRVSTPPRIMGSETEYTNAGDNSSLPVILQCSDLVMNSSNPEWITNGGRLYLDTNDSLIEYATPECNNATQVAVYEQAGADIVGSLVAIMNSQTLISPSVYKRSSYEEIKVGNEVILKAMSAGHHENYFSGMDTSSVFSQQALRSYLATRAIWAGAGIVTPRGYELYQKRSAMGFDQDVSDRYLSHGIKPVFRQNNERLEIRSGDGNMPPWAIVQKFAATSLVLRLIEHQKFASRLIISQSYKEAALTAATTPNTSIKTTKGYYTPIMHQRAIMQACLDFAESSHGREVPKDEVLAAEEVMRACDDIDEYFMIPESLHNISDRIDWAAKLDSLAKSGIPEKAISTRNLDAVRLDLKWEQIGSDSTSARWYKAKGNTTNSDLINIATQRPPLTRARQRTRFISEKLSNLTLDEVDWSHIRTKGLTHKFNDPYGKNEPTSLGYIILL